MTLIRTFRISIVIVALIWVSLTPAAAGDTGFLKGYIHAQNGDPEGAISVWAPLAERGHQRARYALGTLYAQGQGVPVDMAQAFRWWSLAAEGGDLQAQYNIAGMYREGTGTEPDDAQAFSWMMRAAKAGNVDAQLGLVEYYAEGVGVTPDEDEAMFWLQVALLSGGNPGSPVTSRLSRQLRHQNFDRVRTRARDWLEYR